LRRIVPQGLLLLFGFYLGFSLCFVSYSFIAILDFVAGLHSYGFRGERKPKILC
jgi:hypothetical protein